MTAQAEENEGLLDFITRISPSYIVPNHLRKLTDAIERSEREPVRCIVNIPPRHAKTETILHAIARRLKRRPWQNVAYVTYGDDVAREKGTIAREYALRAGVTLRDDTTAKQLWRTTHMGGARFTSIGGQITGTGADLLIVDDPHKDRPDAESPVQRQRVWDWWIGTGNDRVEAGGSVIVCQTRWHVDDLSGKLIDERLAEDGWEVISLPAVGRYEPDGTRVEDETDRGTALWAERWPLEELKKKKIDLYEWKSKFQQNPQKRGGNVFHAARFYDPRKLPPHLRVVIGIDCAYTKDTHADWSTIVVLGVDERGFVYVLNVWRGQVETPQFASVLVGLAGNYPMSPITWHTSTTEKGTAQLLRVLTQLDVRHEPAVVDKFIRSQPVAAQWNMGRVLVPMGYDDSPNGGIIVPTPPWVDPFIREIVRFTGLGDKRDDQVDGLSSAFFPLSKPLNDRHDSD